MTERERGCGYRQLGKLYLVSDPAGVPCDRLPLELKECGCCGYIPEQNRGFTWMHKKFIGNHNGADDVCSCHSTCPICNALTLPYASLRKGTHFGLMWSGTRFYTAREFVKEATEMGVSRAIGNIPQDLVLGKTWVLLAHPEAEIYDRGFIDNNPSGLAMAEPRAAPAIISAFIPQRVEMLLPDVADSTWKQNRQDTLESLGITVVWIPTEDVEKHRGRDYEERLEKLLTRGLKAMEEELEED